MTPWQDERRRHPRIPLQWPAAIRPSGRDGAVPVRTVNLSCAGIYCLAPKAFGPGDELDVLLLLPEEVRPNGRPVQLLCRVTVVRVEDAGLDEDACGLACRILDYRVVVGGDAAWRQSEPAAADTHAA